MANKINESKLINALCNSKDNGDPLPLIPAFNARNAKQVYIPVYRSDKKSK